MEWLNTDLFNMDLRRFLKWSKEPHAGQATMISFVRSFWSKYLHAIHTITFSFVRSFWGKEEHDVHSRDDQIDYARLMALDFCIGLAYGIIVGMGLILYWVYFSRVRSEERQEKASNMAALSDMNLDDVRKFFPQEYFPYWIVMGKYEKVHWINHCIRKAWPFYSKSQSELMKEIWEPWIDPYRPPSISQLSFSKFTLGSIPPVFLGVRMVHTTDDEIAMDAECQWQGNPSIIMKVRTPLGLTFSIQVKDVSMLVVLRISFRPLVDQLPGFGAFTYSIRKNKKFDITLKLIGGDIATIPGLGNSVEEMIKTSFLDTLMWPMRIPVPVIASPVDRDYSRVSMISYAHKKIKVVFFCVVHGGHRDQTLKQIRLQRHFNPRRGAVLYSEYGAGLKAQAVGILDVKLVQAKDLKAKNALAHGKVGPYALLYIRPIPRLMKRSKTIKDNLSPIWNEIYEVEVEDRETQKLVVKILDEDAQQEADLLGCCQLFLRELEPGALTEKWIRLVKTLDTVKEEVKYRGEVNLELLYRPYDNKFQPMWMPEGTNENTGSTSAGPAVSAESSKASTLFNEDVKARDGDIALGLHPLFSYKGQLWEVVRGVLSVTVERAENLVSQDLNGLSDPYVVLKMRKSKFKKKTKIIYRTLNPEWNQTLDFLVEDGIHDMLEIEVWDHDTFGKDFLGSYATTLTKAIHNGEYKAEFELSGVPSGVIFLTLKWIPQPFKSMGQRRFSVLNF